MCTNKRKHRGRPVIDRLDNRPLVIVRTHLAAETQIDLERKAADLPRDVQVLARYILKKEAARFCNPDIRLKMRPRCGKQFAIGIPARVLADIHDLMEKYGCQQAEIVRYLIIIGLERYSRPEDISLMR